MSGPVIDKYATTGGIKGPLPPSLPQPPPHHIRKNTLAGHGEETLSGYELIPIVFKKGRPSGIFLFM